MQTEFLNLTSNSPTHTFKKGEVLQKAGEKSSKTFYVKQGLLRSYVLDEKGKEHTFMFAPEGWIMSDIESQAFEYDALLTMECLEDSEVVVIDRSSIDLNSLSQEEYAKTLQSLFRRVGVLQRRVISLMSSTARERYESFIEIYPELPNRVPQRLIASYLGITPEALSAIRGKIARDK